MNPNSLDFHSTISRVNPWRRGGGGSKRYTSRTQKERSLTGKVGLISFVLQSTFWLQPTVISLFTVPPWMRSHSTTLLSPCSILSTVSHLCSTILEYFAVLLVNRFWPQSHGNLPQKLLDQMRPKKPVPLPDYLPVEPELSEIAEYYQLSQHVPHCILHIG